MDVEVAGRITAGLHEFLEAVANATLLVGEAEGNVARKTHDVLASMKSVEESTAEEQ